MALSSDVIREFAKQAIGETETVSAGKEVTGTATVYEGKYYVTLDGTDQLTPILSSTVGMKAGDRVTVLIADHTAKVTGNVTDPSTQKSTFEDYADDTNTKINEFDNIIVNGRLSADNIDAMNGRINTLISDNALVKETLTATNAKIGTLTTDKTIAEQLEANSAKIDQVEADSLTTAKLEAKYTTIGQLDATTASVNSLKATYADIGKAVVDEVAARKASIDELDNKKLSTEDAAITYANIDFANIDKAAIDTFFTKSGMIENLVIGEATATGALIGVTIKGDLIEGGTVKADKLVVKGSDGLFYKLNTDGVTTSAEQTDENSLNGSVITAKSITAEKVSVNDLVAFGATIGGFTITDSSLYSGVKESATNTTRGVFMDDDGELAVGDGTNYLRYYKDDTGAYKLELSASSVMLKAGSVSVADAIDAATTKADAAKEAADSVKETADSAKETAEAASASIQNLVYGIGDDGAYKSLMTQVGSEFRFDISSIQAALNANSGDIDSLATKTSYIAMKQDEDGNPLLELGKPDEPDGFKVRISNTSLDFMQGPNRVAYISNQQLYIKASTVVDELKIGDETGYIWKRRENGHLGLRYVGGQYNPNLLVGSYLYSDQNPAQTTGTTQDNYVYLDTMWATLEQGKTYTIQAVSELPWASVHSGPTGTATLWIQNTATGTHTNFTGDGVTAGFHSWTFTFTEATSSQVRVRINTYSCGGKFWNFKIEEGSEATEWWPA